MMCDISVLYYFVRGTYITVSFINKLGRGWGLRVPPHVYRDILSSDSLVEAELLQTAGETCI